MGHRSRSRVPRCARCRLHLARCACATAPSLRLETRIVLVMHASEVPRPSATGPLALLALQNAQLYVHGRRDEQVDLAPEFSPGRRVYCLYPSDDARPLAEVAAEDDPRPITLVVPDGSWRQARRAARRVPGIENAPCVVLAPGAPTEWGIRRETKDGGLATCEAIARALGTVEGAEVEAALMGLFREVVAETWATRGRAPPAAATPASSPPAPLDILYEDAHLVAVDKPAGMLVHRGWGLDELPLLQRLRDQIGQRVYPAHRLDRATSGAILFAKSSATAARLQEQFAGRSVTKKYLALCRGHDPALRLVDHPLAQEKGQDKKPAVTELRLLGHHGRYGLYEAIPRTGRVHQVRRHLKHASHPIIGDVRYGKGDHNRHFRENYNFHRLALHCFFLGLAHPVTGAPVQVIAPPGPEIVTLLDRLSIPLPPELG
ncbi:MAG: DTW domain-containing protein [Deltaproteobacteria bacterium]|nr:DTW domain-containing protein [Deltaproteobacteria bacterium]